MSTYTIYKEVKMSFDIETNSEEEALKISKNFVPTVVNDSDEPVKINKLNVTTTYTNVVCVKKSKKPLILIVGKSGSGKTTLADTLTIKYGLEQLESYTTRPMREPNEKGHIFTNFQVYTQHSKEGRIKYEKEIHGNKYWCTEKSFNKSDIYVVDPIIAMDICNNNDGCLNPRPIILVLLRTPKVERIYRMTKRGDSLDEIMRRITNERDWPTYLSEFDYLKNYVYVTMIAVDTDVTDMDEVVRIIFEKYKEASK